jgi:DNA-binding MarR family transcriptional regulator
MKIHEGNFLYALTAIRQRLFAFLEDEMAKGGIADIPPSFGDVLFVLDRRGPQMLQEIARHTMKDKSTVSSVVKRLEAAGYVTKEKVEGDARCVTIALTAKAKRVKASMRGISKKMNSRLFRGLSGGERNELFRLLERVSGNL